ncbi:MAG: MFS transporter [Tannerella sp.]|jgi:ACS family hexuronate transporter-like MFS transporter|nr:MFS transporter [Tannerella sp.]
MKIKGLRWIILSLTALVTTINILDRGTLNYMWNSEVNENTGVVEVYGIAHDLQLIDMSQTKEEQQTQSKVILALINIVFMIAYGISQMVSGKIYDKIGTRKGFSMSALLWGGAVTFTSLANGVKSLIFFRLLLGLGEAGPWPGTTKSNAEWFPVKERALAQGVFGAASSVGNILVPIVIPLLFIATGWRMTFVIVGIICVLWVIPWYIINKTSPKNHPWITRQEREYIVSGQHVSEQKASKTVPIKDILKKKQSYSVIISRFFLDPIWWMFMTWLPIYLHEVYSLSIEEIAEMAWIPFVGAMIGSIAGGSLSGNLIKRGCSVNFARKVSISLGSLLIVPGMIGAAFSTDALTASLWLMFILGGFQFAMTNIQTLPSDFFEGNTVGSLAGIGGASAVVGIVISTYLVPMLTTGGNWMPFFAMGLLLVPLSLASLFIFGGKIQQLK